MMQKIVGKIVNDITRYSTAERRNSNIPIVREDGVRKLPEWYCENKEEGRRQDKTVTIHG
jgi:hypothetical protein